MKVLTCQDEVPKKPEEPNLKFKDIKNTEGVYQCCELSNVSLIVLKNRFGDSYILYFNTPEKRLEPADTGFENPRFSFRKTDKQVCFSLV
jgi:hypothetical protein